MRGFYGTFWSSVRPEQLYPAIYDQVVIKIYDVLDMVTHDPGTEREACQTLERLEQKERAAYGGGTYIETIRMRWESATPIH
jgi:hypothetical protein